MSGDLQLNISLHLSVDVENSMHVCTSLVSVTVNVNVNVQYLSTRKSCNTELRRLRHEGCLQQTTELC